MKFTISSTHLQSALGDVVRAVSSRNAFPIMAGIKIAAGRTGLFLTASNSDFIIERFISADARGEGTAQIEQAGTVVLPAQLFHNIVRKLPGDISFSCSGNHLAEVRSEGIHTVISGMDPGEYPALPSVEGTFQAEIEAGQLLELIKGTAFAVSKNQSRPVLTGVFMEFQENFIDCAATDSHRLARKKLEFSGSLKTSVIIPSISLNELARLLNHGGGTVQITISEAYAIFSFNGTSLYSRLIEGNYPKISGLSSGQFKSAVTLDRRKLLEGIERAGLFASQWKNHNIHLNLENRISFRIATTSNEMGKIEEFQKVEELQGDGEFSVMLDGHFLSDALKSMSDEEVVLKFDGTMRPVLIHPAGGREHLHLISPVRSF
ncbi:DNA polymerase III subunit beta [Peribacillus sp. SCS-37]|uniref:DNA polymerase III subunit beta n=1 Tax=Paraperibacillus esterisolvens TaxID=3115296 RepID=UPI0039062B9C